MRLRSYMKPDQETEARAKEAESLYLSVLDSLLPVYKGKWVVMDGTSVVAAADDPLSATFEANAKSGDQKQLLLKRVGYEDAEFRVRRIEFSYDSSYQPFPLPRARVDLKNFTNSANATIDDMVLDTGADVTCIRQSDRDAAQLTVAKQVTFSTRAYGHQPRLSVFYPAFVEIDGKAYRSLVQIVPDSEERILGRDVLNQLKTTFDGPQGKVTIE